MKIAKKTEWKSLGTRQRARCNSYSILFNLCGSPGFYHQCQNPRNRVRLFISTLLAEKRNWVLEKWKSPGIVLEKSWNSVFPFPCEPYLNTRFACCRLVVLSLNCFVPIHTTVMLTVCYINRQPGREYHYSDTKGCGESAASKNTERNFILSPGSCPTDGPLGVQGLKYFWRGDLRWRPINCAF